MKYEQQSTPLFLSMLKNPRVTGTVMPSSRYLARVMADASSGADKIIELGGGTGAITKILLELYPDTPITTVEYQEALAKKLCEYFNGLDVRNDTAKSVLDSSPGSNEYIVLVSSLPFRSLPEQVKNESIKSILDFFDRHPYTRLIQFTYLRIAPFELPAEEKQMLNWRMIDTIWRNIPPATVWELSRSYSAAQHAL